MPFTSFHQGRQQHDALLFKLLLNLFQHFLFRKADHFFTGFVTVGFSRASIQEANKIVNLRHGAYGRAWTFIGRFLFNGHHRRKPIYLINIGAFHIPHKLPGISRKAFHISALSFGMNRIECQRRFSATAYTGNNS